MNSTADTDTYLTHSKISRQSNALDCSHVRLEEAISLVGRRHIMPLLRAPLEHMDNVVIVLHRNVFALPTPVREIGSQEPRPASDARSKWWSVSCQMPRLFAELSISGTHLMVAAKAGRVSFQPFSCSILTASSLIVSAPPVGHPLNAASSNSTTGNQHLVNHPIRNSDSEGFRVFGKGRLTTHPGAGVCRSSRPSPYERHAGRAASRPQSPAMPVADGPSSAITCSDTPWRLGPQGTGVEHYVQVPLDAGGGLRDLLHELHALGEVLRRRGVSSDSAPAHTIP